MASPPPAGLMLKLATLWVVMLGVVESSRLSNRDMLEMQIVNLHKPPHSLSSPQPSPASSSSSSPSPVLVHSSLPHRPSCSHGYLSAADRATCVCNTGWTGPDCSTDALPSCARGRGEPCFGDLRLTETAKTQSCECLTECVDYVQESVRKAFGEKGYNASGMSPLVIHPSLLRCSQTSDYITSNLVRVADDLEQEPDEKKNVGTSFEDCAADCSGAPGHVCSAHFCECPEGRVGAFCQGYADKPARLGSDDSMLTFQILEFPGSLLLDRTFESLYHRRADDWAPPYFLEQLLRDDTVLVDDNASVILLPYVIDPGVRAATWLQGLQRSGDDGDGGGVFPTLERPVIDSESSRGSLRPILTLSAVYERWGVPRANDPKSSFYLQNTGLPDTTGALIDIAMPLHDYKLMTDIRDFRTMNASDIAAQLAALPKLKAERRPYFNSSAKTLELFFVGRTRLDRAVNPSEPPAHCLDERMFTSNPDECNCLLQYSECVRQYLFHNYRDHPKMFLRDPKIEQVPKVANVHLTGQGHMSAQWALSDEHHMAAFCLVAGGNNFDMRIVSAIMSGCIPLWTFLEQTPPMPRIMRHERMLVELTAATRPALAHIESLFECYTPAVREALVANLEMTWPAFAWGNGTAYHHVLLEIAELTDKLVPSAMAVILQAQGPQYVSEMLKVDLNKYSFLPGMDKAIQMRLEMSMREEDGSDPFANLLKQVEQCVNSIPGVGSPEALASAETFASREHWDFWLNETEALQHRSAYVRSPFPDSIRRGRSNGSNKH